MNFIILTAEQAEEVSGLTSPGHALAPRPLKSGGAALPISVIFDPAHVQQHETLGAIAAQDGKVRTVAADEWGDADE